MMGIFRHSRERVEMKARKHCFMLNTTLCKHVVFSGSNVRPGAWTYMVTPLASGPGPLQGLLPVHRAVKQKYVTENIII